MLSHTVFASQCVLSMLIMFQVVGCTSRETASGNASQKADGKNEELQVLELGEQARKNLNLVVRVARPTDYWRTLTIPGVVADRPGVSDRGVTSPAVGVVSEIHAYPGDTVLSGQRLVTLRLFSEYMQATQTQLFVAVQEAKLIQEQVERLNSVASSGAVSGSRLIEQRNELQRQQTLIQAYKQELLNRGLNPVQIAAVSAGDFISTIDVSAPPMQPDESDGQATASTRTGGDAATNGMAYELQTLDVELGQTVQAGDLLVSLANHQSLYIIGHAFKREAALLERAAKDRVALRVEFAEDSSELWPAQEQEFHIRHLANTIDPSTRTFDFFVPLQNQSRSYQQDGATFLVWRFRPGQRTRIEVPTEKLMNVFVLPTDAVVREGPNAYVYQQNGDLFKQISVHIIYEDRDHAILANDRSITPGTFLAQNSAASLRRVLKAQSASGEQPGFHVHADGTVHAAH